MQLGFFDIGKRLIKLDEKDKLPAINKMIPWESFSGILQDACSRDKKNNAGRKPFDRLMMFKCLILQALYNLSDEELEYQIRDRLSFCRFLGLGTEAEIPDAKTIWLFRETLAQAGALRRLFNKFDKHLARRGYQACRGTIIDATIVEVPKQKMESKEREELKSGIVPQSWTENESRRVQKDTDARWTQVRGKSYYGYKNHIAVDNEHKLIRNYTVSNASSNESLYLKELLDPSNSSNAVWADAGYDRPGVHKALREGKYVNRVIRQRHHPHELTARTLKLNQVWTPVRKRVEHVFGAIKYVMKGGYLRGVGIVRIGAKIALQNLAYNFTRYVYLNS